MRNDYFYNENSDIKKYQLKKSADNWMEESFGKFSWLYNGRGGQGAVFLGILISKTKFLLIKLFILVIILLLISQSFYLQIASGSQYKAHAETNRIRQVPIAAERGIIYDRNQKPLVGNTPNFYLAMATGDLPKEAAVKNDLLKKLA